MPMPADVPPPEAATTFEWAPAFDLRFVTPEQGRAPVQRLWFKAAGTLPDDPLLHVCVVAYASDMTLLDPVVNAHGIDWEDPGLQVASLDHAMWFHRPFRADEWLLYDQESPAASRGRGLALGRIFRADGTLAVSVVQEGLVRTTPR
jgi:acyl-CoA thioesterase-2